MSALRTIPLALGWLLSVIPASAQAAGKPSIFSDVAPPRLSMVKKLELPAVDRSQLPLSNHVRAALSERMTANAATLQTANTWTVAEQPKQGWEYSADALVMERFVVAEQREKKVETVNVPGYLAKAFTTGDIFSTERLLVRWGLGAATTTVYGARENTPRVELSMTLRW